MHNGIVLGGGGARACTLLSDPARQNDLHRRGEYRQTRNQNGRTERRFAAETEAVGGSGEEEHRGSPITDRQTEVIEEARDVTYRRDGIKDTHTHTRTGNGPSYGKERESYPTREIITLTSANTNTQKPMNQMVDSQSSRSVTMRTYGSR